jgi:hypothetical protein
MCAMSSAGMKYRIHDVVIESSIVLSDLVPETTHAATISFTVERGTPSQSPATQWLHPFSLRDGRPWLEIGRRDSGYIFRFPTLADFVTDTSSGDVRCYPRPDTAPETIQHLLLDQIIPLLLSDNNLVLHASAVVADGTGAVAFLGPTGTGKSTVAASFCAAGARLLADDALQVVRRRTQTLALPSYPGLRLWPDTLRLLNAAESHTRPVAHYTNKQRISSAEDFRFCGSPVPLRRIYVLSSIPNPEAPVLITPLSGHEALMQLVRHAYRIDVEDVQKLATQLQRLRRECLDVTVCRLELPRGLSRLRDVRAAIAADLTRVQEPA